MECSRSRSKFRRRRKMLEFCIYAMQKNLKPAQPPVQQFWPNFDLNFFRKHLAGRKYFRKSQKSSKPLPDMRRDEARRFARRKFLEQCEDWKFFQGRKLRASYKILWSQFFKSAACKSEVNFCARPFSPFNAFWKAREILVSPRG